MAEIPLLFSESMVRALLAEASGRPGPAKINTRRMLKPRNSVNFDGAAGGDWGRAWCTKRGTAERPHLVVPMSYRKSVHVFPKATAGDVVWVRETWARHRGKIIFRASGDFPRSVRWRSGIFLARKHARLTMALTEVWIERLQSITVQGMLDEGIRHGERLPMRGTVPDRGHVLSSFVRLWDGINGMGSWASNPWVIVYAWQKVEVLR